VNDLQGTGKTCAALPIIRFLVERDVFVMSCWHCDWTQEIHRYISSTDAKILISRHYNHQW